MMKRRTFVWASVFACAAIVTPQIIKRRLKHLKNSYLIHPNILSHICDEQSLRQIGIAYRSHVPEENSEKKIRALLQTGNESLNDYKYLISADTMQLEENIRCEFKSNKYLISNGWLISTTEARQCALLSFTN